MNRGRVAVKQALGRANGFRSAQELYAELRAHGQRIGLTTVYRALQALSDDGEVDVLRSPSGEVTYRDCASGMHHHHLVCRNCGRTVEVTAEPVERWARTVAARHGFREIAHTLEVSGVCAQCGRPPATRPPRGHIA